MGVLSGIVVLDLSALFAGPYCTSLLQSMGAEVWKVERPGIGDFSRQTPAVFANLKWGKRSLTLDFAREEGKSALLRLAMKADVVVEGFRPGVMARLGLDYPALKAINPKIVYCSISGYGQEGPYCGQPGHDTNYQAISGVLGIYREGGNDDSMVPGMPLALKSSGLWAAFAIAGALVEQQRTGLGRQIDLAMIDGLFNWASMFDFMRFPPDSPLYRPGCESPFQAIPSLGVFKTRDGKPLALALEHEDNLWKKFCVAVGLPQWHDMDFAARIEAGDEIREGLCRLIRQKDRDEWIRLFEAGDVPAAPVNTIEEAMHDPQILHRRLVSQVIDSDGMSVSLLRNPVVPPEEAIEGQGPPRLGEHTGELLEKVGYSRDEIENLRSQKIV